MEIKRIKVKEYYRLYDKSIYDFAISNALEFQLEKDCIEIGEIGELTFELIKDFQDDLEDGTITFQKQIEYLKRIKPDLNIDNLYLDDLCNSITYLTLGIIKILEIENDVLSGEVTQEELSAGVERFAPLSIYLQYRQLANNDITKISEIKKLSYNTCFVELYTMKQEADFRKDLQTIYNNKITK